MTLTAADFLPIVTTITDNAPIFIGFAVSVAAVMVVVRWVRRTVKA
jgi:hypothetical protein